MPELFSQKLRTNFTPEQQDYYLQLVNELKELLGGQTQEEVLTSGDPAIIQKILKIKQEMLNFVLTKKTREMVRQEKPYSFAESGEQKVSLDDYDSVTKPINVNGQMVFVGRKKDSTYVVGYQEQIIGDKNGYEHVWDLDEVNGNIYYPAQIYGSWFILENGEKIFGDEWGYHVIKKGKKMAGRIIFEVYP